MQTPNGILPVDKPAGWTSFDVLAKLRGALGTRKLGHSGTLDPMATGVLAVFIGKATAAADRQLDHDKTYEATVRFGLRTDTGDITGTPLQTADTAVTAEALQAVLPRFLGEQMQLPPMYSAVRIDGRRLYDYARAGETDLIAERVQPRRVYIRNLDIELIDFAHDSNIKKVTFVVECSKGTYIRTLCHDIGEALGCVGMLTALRRTETLGFTTADCHTLEELKQSSEEGRFDELLMKVNTT